MRWQRLFEDLEAQFQRECDLEWADHQRDQRRRQVVQRDTASLLQLAVQAGVTIELFAASRWMTGTIVHVGSDWVALRGDRDPGRDVHIVALEWLGCIDGLDHTLMAGECAETELRAEFVVNGEPADEGNVGGPPARTEGPMVGLVGPGSAMKPIARGTPIGEWARRLNLTALLGDLARRRVGVTMLVAGREMSGTIDVVGRDWCVLARHAPEERPRPKSVTGYSVISTGAIQIVTLWT